MIEHDIAHRFFEVIVEQARGARLMSDEHFTVDGMLIEAWASLKSFKKKGTKGNDSPPGDPGNPSVDFRAEKRSNETHASTTDPESKLDAPGLMGPEARVLGRVVMGPAVWTADRIDVASGAAPLIRILFTDA